ncbi:MAG TPA: MFS transporter, partial [Baekduia sp.]
MSTLTISPRTRARSGLVLAVASGAAFLAMLDATVANLAVADLHRDFPGVAVGDLSWVITIYAITFAALLAPGGRFADLLGRRALLTAGAALFTIMSIVAAAAPSLGILLAARGLQGAGAAAMIPASLAVVLADTPPERRAAAIGAWSAAGALAAAAGPAIGGVLVDVAGWRSVFFITIP